MYRACCPTNKKKGGWCFCSAQCVVKRNKHAGQYRRKRNAPEKATLYCYGKFFAQSWTMKDLKILTGDSFSRGTPLECTAIRQVFWWCSWFTVDKKLQMDSRKSPFQFPVTPPVCGWNKPTLLINCLKAFTSISQFNPPIHSSATKPWLSSKEQGRLDKRSNDVHSNSGMMRFVVK